MKSLYISAFLFLRDATALPAAFASPSRVKPNDSFRGVKLNGVDDQSDPPVRARYDVGAKTGLPFSVSVAATFRGDADSVTRVVIDPEKSEKNAFMGHDPSRLDSLWDRGHFDRVDFRSSGPNGGFAGGPTGLGGPRVLNRQDLTEILKGEKNCRPDPITGAYTDACVRLAEDRAAAQAYAAADQDSFEPSDETSRDGVWDCLRLEAGIEAGREPLLVSYMYSSVLCHSSLESALAALLANKLGGTGMISTQLMSLVAEALQNDEEFRKSFRKDMCAVRDRDPACTCFPDVFLYFKGFHAIQTYRVAHYLWKSGRQVLAHYLQSRCSQAFQIDIHPGATIGSGVMLDHGTGIIIGETARVGDGCSILHHVTLGGSGREGMRHPRVGKNCLIGAGASLLGPLVVGDGCQVGAGSLVIQDLPDRSVAVGVPAKIIGTLKNQQARPAEEMNQVNLSANNDEIFPYYGQDI